MGVPRPNNGAPAKVIRANVLVRKSPVVLWEEDEISPPKQKEVWPTKNKVTKRRQWRDNGTHFLPWARANAKSFQMMPHCDCRAGNGKNIKGRGQLHLRFLLFSLWKRGSEVFMECCSVVYKMMWMLIRGFAVWNGRNEYLQSAKKMLNIWEIIRSIVDLKVYIFGQITSFQFDNVICFFIIYFF